MPVDQVIIPFFSVTIYFVKYNNSIPFSKEQLLQASKSFVDCCNQFIHFSSRPHVHFCIKLEVLIRYFIEKLTWSNSVSLLTIIKEINVNNTLCCPIIKHIFLCKEIRYLITTQSILTPIVLNNSKSIASQLSKQQQGA